MLANEKRRRRRESHNAVERRRRDNINEKISELATLIPECLLDPSTTTSTSSSTNANGTSTSTSANGLGVDEVLVSPTSPIGGLFDDEDGKDGVKEGKDGKEKDAGKDGAVKANKGMILRKSVEYIRYVFFSLPRFPVSPSFFFSFEKS